MSKITLVEPQKKKPHRFNIFLDGTFAFGADEDLVVDYRLVPGKQLTTSDVEQLLFEAEVGKLMERMYVLWNVRPRSEKEVRDYFRIKNYQLKIKEKEQISDLAVELVIKKLAEKGMLNDKEFVKAWVESRRRSKQKGNRALMAELLQKGVDRNIIIEALRLADARSGQVSEENLAKLALEKKLESFAKLPYLEKKKKMYEFLLRHGFDYSVVKSVVDTSVALSVNPELKLKG